MNDHWILDKNKQPQKVSMEEWLEWIKDPKAKIIKQEDSNGFHVSTVFLSLDHNFSAHLVTNSEPLVFETMIFGMPGESEYQTRCSTYAQALIMHEEALLYTMQKEADHDTLI